MKKVLSWEEANKNIDPKIIAAAQALADADLVKIMQADLEEKDARIAELEAALRDLNPSHPLL